MAEKVPVARDCYSRQELIRKYRLAGKIRFISFSLLLLFLLFMKSAGGYAYLNTMFMAVVFIEAVLNQPYTIVLNRVNIHRLQYYQMMTDIIVISCVLHYMGGIEAPIVSMAYYAVILWAGVASTTQAVFFATIASALLFSSIVILGHFGLIPFISHYDYKIQTAQMFSLLFGNVSFLFGFGYFSAHSSGVIKSLERKRQEASLRNAHKLLVTAHLIAGTAHDILGRLAGIRGYIQVLLTTANRSGEETEMLKAVEGLERQGTDLLNRLARFSQRPDNECEHADINIVIEDSLRLTWPLVRYSEMVIERSFGSDMPLIMANKAQLQEVFVVMILNAFDATSGKGKLSIKTIYFKKDGVVEITFSDTGRGIKETDLKRIGEPFFTTKEAGEGSGLGLPSAYGIIRLHDGKIDCKSTAGKGATFIITLPIKAARPFGSTIGDPV